MLATATTKVNHSSVKNKSRKEQSASFLSDDYGENLKQGLPERPRLRRREPYVPGQFSERPAVPQQVRQPQQERLVQSPVRPKPQLPEKRKLGMVLPSIPVS